MSRESSGVAFALCAVAIWGGWIAATHSAVGRGALSGIDAGLFRFGIPMLLLAPAWLRVGPFPLSRGSPTVLLFVGLAWGPTFVIPAVEGMAFAPISHFSVLGPGTMFFWSAAISFLLFGERPDRRRILGYVLIVSAVVLIAIDNLFEGGGESERWIGYGMFLFAAMSWACYASAFRRSSLSALEATGIASFWSFAAHASLAAIFGTSVFDLPVETLLEHATVQGVGSGLASVLFSLAVVRLGASEASAFTALVPMAAAVAGAAALGSYPSAFSWAALATALPGSLLAAGFLRRRTRRRSERDPKDESLRA